MEPLLKISTTDIQLECHAQKARLEIDQQQPSVQIDRTPGQLRIQRKRGQLMMDTYDARASMGYRTVTDSVKKQAADGYQKAQQATADAALEGDRLAETENPSNAFAEIAMSKQPQMPDTQLGFLPSAPIKIQYQPEELSMQYQADRLSFDWRTQNQADLKYVPGELDFQVTQYPKVNIEYIGGPLYVPPSADPEYEPKFDTVA